MLVASKVAQLVILSYNKTLWDLQMAVRLFALPGPYVQRIAAAPSCLPVSSSPDTVAGWQLAGIEECTQWVGTLPEKMRCHRSRIEVAEPDGMPYVDRAGPFVRDVRMAYQGVEVLVGMAEVVDGTRRDWRLGGLARALVLVLELSVARSKPC